MNLKCLLLKTLAENCKLRSDLEFEIKKNKVLSNLLLGEINEKI